VRHPAAYAARLAAGSSPAQAREVLSPDQARFEDIMLGVRLASGYPLADLPPAGRDYAERAVADLLVDPAALHQGRVTLTRRGRLLADAVVRGLTG
jgi:oxygen-independent coproporphyrinogen-3 oxidase